MQWCIAWYCLVGCNSHRVRVHRPYCPLRWTNRILSRIDRGFRNIHLLHQLVQEKDCRCFLSDEFEFQGDTEFVISLEKLLSSSTALDTVYVYAKPKGKDFGSELIKRIELKVTEVPVSTFAVDG